MLVAACPRLDGGGKAGSGLFRFAFFQIDLFPGLVNSIAGVCIQVTGVQHQLHSVGLRGCRHAAVSLRRFRFQPDAAVVVGKI